MNEQEALQRMVAPGTRRPGKYREGVIQIHVTRSCDKACFGCTQGSNLGGKATFITRDNFEKAVVSLKGYFGVVGVFGGNPALHPLFEELCDILATHIPYEQRGLWCNHPINLDKAKKMRQTFNPAVSNLNVHLDQDAYDLFLRGWPECRPVGLRQDSRHSPPFVAMRDALRKDCPDCENESGYRVYCKTCEGSGRAGTVYDEEKAWELISNCDINQHWSAMLGQFRGELRAWFCEIAGAQSILHQDEPDYPDTGLDLNYRWSVQVDDLGLQRNNPEPEKITRDIPGGHPLHHSFRELQWWQLPMYMFREQVRKHCHDCGVPLRGYGELAQSLDGKEQVSATHQSVYKPKRRGRAVELVTTADQLQCGRIDKVTTYLQNSAR